jgi:hypothetical protein
LLRYFSLLIVGLLAVRTLSVAGVKLVAHSRLELVDLGDPCYLPFQVASDCHAPDSSTIDIEVLDYPAPANPSPQYFDTGGEWMAQIEDDGYRLNLFGDGEGNFSMVARSNAETTKVVVHAPLEATSSPPPPGQLADPVRYPLDQLLMMNHLALRGGVIVHAAAAVIQDKALVFPGVSGAGKSTLCRLFMAGGHADSLLSDDRVILWAEGSDGASAPAGEHKQAEIWGTPWPGDAGVAQNTRAPLGALLFLVKADQTELVRLPVGMAMRRLMPVVSCPWYDRVRGNLVLETCAQAVETFPCYDLRFRADSEVVGLLTGWSWAEAVGPV